MQTPHRLTLAASLLGLSILSPVHAALDDTGITTCSNATQNGLTCPQAGFPRQDAEYGTNKFNFTKLDANGRALASTATAWTCVQDNITGLVWEVKTSDGGLRDKTWTYTWYNSNSTDGNLGTPSGTTNCKTTGRCDTEKFVQDVNATSLCGHNDWRLPDPKELFGIVDESISYPGPTINTEYFPNTLGNNYWTTFAVAWDSSLSWMVGFDYGWYYYYGRANAYATRLVRGLKASPVLQDQNDGTIFDTTTGLLWAKCSIGQTGNDCSGGSASNMTWASALSAGPSSTLAGHSDWRLPNVKELQSIVDYSRYSPSVNATYFPNTYMGYYWTSSAYAHDSSNSWIVHFDYGYVHVNDRNDGYAVRLVRGGQSFGFLALTISRLGTGSGVVVSDPAGINCPALCSSANFYPTTSVVLAAIPATGSVFAGWGGDCATTGTVTMNANKTCTATFNPALAVPSVITGTPSVITATSATLTGTVTPNGAVTTTSFEFGPTTSYGTTITATPASIAIGAAATAISATRTGLNCYTLYHYRAKAVNSVGTSYGADKSFTTSSCSTDLALTLSDGRSGANAGTTLTYQAIVKNLGPRAANNAVLKAPAVANLTVTSVTCGSVTGGAVCPASPTVANLQGTGLVIPTLPNGGSLTFTISATLAAATPVSMLTYTATLTTPSGISDTNLANNTAKDQDRVANLSDLVVTGIVLTPATPTANSTFSAAVTVKNQGYISTNQRIYLDVWANQATAQTCVAMGDAWADISALTLTAGASATYTLSLPTGSAGTKTLRTFVDSWCEVPESNEANNQLTKVYTVQ